MRRLSVPVLLVLLLAPAVAQDSETPRQSFQKFIDAVLSDEISDDDRTAAFDRYFDFKTWLADKQAREGTVYTRDEQAELKADWHELFRSDEFRRRYRQSDVKIETAKVEDTKAELRITLGEQQFRVLMNASEDGAWWRWHSIPPVETLDPAARIAEIEETLKQLRAERERLNRIEDALLDELARLRSEAAEEDAGASDYSTPQSVVKTAWRAIESGDVNALLDCHTGARVAAAKTEAVKANVQVVSQRLMTWEVLDSTVDARDRNLATVRVRVKLRPTGGVGDLDDRTVNVRVTRAGDNWKIDEAP